MPVKTIEWKDGKVIIIDQTKLPETLVYLEIEDYKELVEAIKRLSIRGAPAIGIASAMGVALAAHHYPNRDKEGLIKTVRKSLSLLAGSRPTAVNLFWALNRMEEVLKAVSVMSVDEIKLGLLQEALSIREEDKAICRKMGDFGAALLPQSCTVLTHCNAGGLATADFGTALGLIYTAVDLGKKVKVYADETRPLLQGSRLTAWELMQSDIDVTVLCDSAAGSLLKQGMIDAVIVGADRIAANGDTANKVGTYSLAVLAKENNIPLYVTAPVSTFDFSTPSGDEIPVEQRSAEEVINWFGKATSPEGVSVYNPAFDVTPGPLISAFITEKGIVQPPFENLKDVLISNS